MEETLNHYLNMASDLGFSHFGPLNMSALTPLTEVREMCSSDRCHAYGNSWSCPPACGSLEFTSRRMAEYRKGILVQTTGNLEDDFDIQGISQTEQQHKAAFQTLVRQFRQAEPDCLPLSAGTCRICIRCTYPDRPCRFPNRKISSMEAFGLLVSDVCLKSGLQYNYGPRTITYSSCILFSKG